MPSDPHVTRQADGRACWITWRERGHPWRLWRRLGRLVKEPATRQLTVPTSGPADAELSSGWYFVGPYLAPDGLPADVAALAAVEFAPEEP